MNKSEIFDNYVKIAIGKDRVEDTDSSKAKAALEKNPILNHVDLTKLYNLKLDCPKDSEYKRNIIEIAHPNSVIVSPSYDRINGLVENENERQDITINKIIHKIPTGTHTNTKYAQKELLATLVRTANYLDNIDNIELTTLADRCILQISKQNITKTALSTETEAGAASAIGTTALVGGAVALGLVGTPLLIASGVILGALYIQQHLNNVSEGFEKDHQKLIAEIDDVLNSSSSWQTAVGAGYDYSDTIITLLKSVKSKLVNMFDIYQKLQPNFTALQMPQGTKELIEMAKQVDTKQLDSSIISFNNLFNELKKYLEQLKTDFGNQDFKNLNIKNKGWISSLVDKMQIFHGGHGLINDDLDDIRNLIPTYIEDVNAIQQLLSTSNKIKDGATKELIDAQQTSSTTDSAQTKTKPSSVNSPLDNTNDLDSSISNLQNMLSKSLGK